MDIDEDGLESVRLLTSHHKVKAIMMHSRLESIQAIHQQGKVVVLPSHQFHLCDSLHLTFSLRTTVVNPDDEVHWWTLPHDDVRAFGKISPALDQFSRDADRLSLFEVRTIVGARLSLT